MCCSFVCCIVFVFAIRCYVAFVFIICFSSSFAFPPLPLLAPASSLFIFCFFIPSYCFGPGPRGPSLRGRPCEVAAVGRASARAIRRSHLSAAMAKKVTKKTQRVSGPRKKTRSTYKGTAENLVNAIRPHAKQANFLKHSARLSGSIILCQKDMFKSLLKLQDNLSFPKLKVKSALKTLLKDCNDKEWHTPVEKKEEVDWCDKMCKRFKSQCRFIQTSMCRKPPGKWLKSLQDASGKKDSPKKKDSGKTKASPKPKDSEEEEWEQDELGGG